MPGLISTKSASIHRALKRPIANVYSLSNLVSFEVFVNTTIRELCDQLDKVYTEQAVPKTCDLAFWLQAFAFDALGQLTFSKHYGFMERAEDVEGIMDSIWKHFEKVSLVGQIPWIDTLLRINPLISKISKKPISPIAKFAIARMQERKIRSQTEEDIVNNRDLLSRFLEAQAKNPETPPYALMSWVTGNITAAGDTTATILRTIFYYLLKHSNTLETLRNEIETATKSGSISQPVAWHEIKALKYLDACILEAQRIHAPVGLHLERVVPKEGATISGQYLKGGTVVGINAWVVHRDTEIFGNDVDVWRPDRWIDCTEGQRVKMEKALFTFGAGARVCIGKNFSLLVIYKVVPSLLQRFEVSLKDPTATWTVENRWFVVQRDFPVSLKKLAL